MPTTIYALVQGQYSDYRIKALFPTKELAEAAVKADLVDEDDSFYETRVEEFELWDQIPAPVTVYEVRQEIWDDGTETSPVEVQETHLPWNHYWANEELGRPKVRFVRAPMYRDNGGRLEVRGTDYQAVMQAFGDARARRLAEIEGIA